MTATGFGRRDAGCTFRIAARIEQDREGDGAAQRVVPPPVDRGRVHGEPHVGQPADHRPDRDPCLEPGQPGAEAEVRTVAECQVAVSGTADVEPVGVVEGGRIAVRRPEHDPHRLPGWQPHTVDLDLDRGDLHVPLERALELQDLLDGARDQPRIGRQPGELVGCPQQGVDPVRDEARGRLVAG